MSEWILVSERLPEVDQRVLYYFDITGITAGRYEGDNCFASRAGFLTGDVTHWMPLPKEPEA